MQKENWQPYINLFLSFSAWLAGPIIVALLAGNWIDGWYASKPWGTLGCIGIAFIIANVGIAREARRMMSQLEAGTKKPSTTNDPGNARKLS